MKSLKLRFKGAFLISKFAFVIIMFWSLFFLRNYLWINAKDTLSNYLLVIVLIIFAIIIISFFFDIRKIRKENTGIKKTAFVLVIFSLFSMHSIMCIHYYDKMGKSANMVGSIYDKQKNENSYYAVIKGNNNRIINIECSKDIYEDLIIDENIWYSYTYRILQYEAQNGVLESGMDTTMYVKSK